jgi:putative Mn2+ efflux pump MntP
LYLAYKEVKFMLLTAVYLLFIALINSFDNIGVRLAYSIGGVKVQFLKNILISLMAFAVSFAASLSGNVVSHLLNEDIASILSMIILSAAGIHIIYEGCSKKDEIKDLNSHTLSYKESASVGTALALDDIGGSVGVGLAGYSPLAVGAAFFTVSFLIFISGNYLIKFSGRFRVSRKTTAMLAGIIMILIGIAQVLE